jgi:hypothetical protein
MIKMKFKTSIMKTMKFLTVFFIVLCVCIQSYQLYGMNGKLMAGSAKVNITPKTNESLHDSLKVEEAFGNKANCLFVQGAGGNIESLIISSRRTGPDDPFQTDYSTIERVGELLAIETIKLTKSLRPEMKDEIDIKYMNDSLKFIGRFDKTAVFNIHLSTILINNDIVIATCPGEPFIQLQLDWKKKMEEASANPFLFGYTWYEGTWPNYIADIKSAALGGYGADQNSQVTIEVGAGEAIMNKHFENYFRLTGLMNEKPGPTGFTPGPRWNVTPIPREK